jgi:hypothetical protein
VTRYGSAERHHAGEEEAEQGRGHQPSCPGPPEGREIDAAATLDLYQQERGDQESRQDEERRDRQIAAPKPGDPRVETDDAKEREPTQPIEGGDVGQTRRTFGCW